jgi:hypothetical protein
MEGIVYTYTVIFSTPTFPSKIFGEITFLPVHFLSYISGNIQNLRKNLILISHTGKGRKAYCAVKV